MSKYSSTRYQLYLVYHTMHTISLLSALILGEATQEKLNSKIKYYSSTYSGRHFAEQF